MEMGKYNFHLLHEEAEAKDEFVHNTHENAADSLCEIIVRENQGATIGLEGPWGGGKSTVLKILKTKLKNIGHVFMFDTWAHEGDCLRRVFLESLIVDVLQAIKVGELQGDIIQLDKLLKKIDGRERTSVVHTKRKPTWAAIGSIISGFLLMVGTTFIQISRGGACWKNWTLFSVGLLLVLIPVIWVACRSLSRKDKASLLEVWSFLDSDSDETITQDVSDENERSSVEFERLFSEIMDMVCKSNSDKKFILAIDNLDRIAKNDALLLWSTLQTFLQLRSGYATSADWFERLWIVVPYDPDGLRKVWANSDESAGTEESVNDEKSNSFMDKCFQVRIEVPRPVLSDWESFARKQIGNAFGENLANDQEEMIRVLRNTRSSLDSIPTPREIKIFVNQVAVFRNQFCSAIETRTIAFYVIKRFIDKDRLSVDKIRHRLLDKTFPSKKDLPYLPRNVAEQISGIIFGVSPEIGQQLLLLPKVSDALENFKPESLKELVANHGDAAWMAFDNYVSGSEFLSDSSDIAKFITVEACVSSAKFEKWRLKTFSDVTREYLDRIIRMSPGSRHAFFVNDEERLAKTVEAIKGLSMLVEEDSLRRLYTSLVDEMSLIIEQTEDIKAINLGMAAKTVISAFPTNIAVVKTCNAFNALKLAQFCASLPALDYSLGKIIKPAPSIAGDLVSHIQPDTAIPGYLGRAVKYCLEADVFEDWLSVVEACKKHILSNNGRTDGNAPSRRALDILLFIIGKNERYAKDVNALLREGAFYNFVATNMEERGYKAALLLTICAPDNCENIQVRSHVGGSQSGVSFVQNVLNTEKDDEIKKLLDLIREFGVEHLMRRFATECGCKVFGGMVRYGMDNPEYAFFNLQKDDPLDSIWVYGEHLKQECMEDVALFHGRIEKYMEYLDKEYNVVSVLKKNKIVGQDFIHCSNYILFFLDRHFDELNKVVVESCNALNEDDCRKALQEADFRGLLSWLSGKGCQGFAGIEYFKALKTILQGKGDMGNARDGFVKLVDSATLKKLVLAMKVEYRGKLSEAISNTLQTIDKNKTAPYYAMTKTVCRVDDIPSALVDSLAWDGIVEKRAGLLLVAADLVISAAAHNNAWEPADEIKRQMNEPLINRLRQKEGGEVGDAVRVIAKYYGAELDEHDGESGELDASA